MTRKREAGRQKQARASGLTRGGTEATSGRHSLWKDGGAGARHGRGGGEQEAMLWKKGSHCGREQDLAPQRPAKATRTKGSGRSRPPPASRCPKHADCRPTARWPSARSLMEPYRAKMHALNTPTGCVAQNRAAV
jgi:hypothetical protein